MSVWFDAQNDIVTSDIRGGKKLLQKGKGGIIRDLF